MAAIEKVCEFSGEYPGHDMYGYKRNHIQIMPKYRKQFRGHEAVLFVFKDGYVESSKSFYTSTSMECVNPNPTEEDWDSGNARRVVKIENGRRVPYIAFFDNVQEYKEYLKTVQTRLLVNYTYILYVPTLPGEVDGMYMNTTRSLSKVLRRMKRLVGTRNLKISYQQGHSKHFVDKLCI